MSNPYTEGYFTRKEGSNYDGYEFRQEYADRAKRIVEEFDPQGAVLEVGCAKGYVLRELQDLGIDAYGIDVSDWAVKHAVANNVKRGDIVNGLPFPDKMFELVVSFDTLEHIEEKHLPFVLEELSRVAERQWHVITTTDYNLGGDATHVTMQSLQWWKERFGEDGERIIIESFR